MGKKSDQPLDEINESHTQVHVETNTTQTAGSGATPPPASDAAAKPAAAAQPAPGPTSAPSAGHTDHTAELTADLQRLQAEFANFRRRAEAERAEVLDIAKNRIVREFLTVRDSFDAEQSHRPAGADPAWAKSIDAIRTQFDQVLKTLGVERFESKGQPFDPHLHEAIAMEDGEGSQEVVVEELQPGYKLGGTILRHAVVKVGKN
jgi:molecular chaperone GrpE